MNPPKMNSGGEIMLIIEVLEPSRVDHARFGEMKRVVLRAHGDKSFDRPAEACRHVVQMFPVYFRHWHDLTLNHTISAMITAPTVMAEPRANMAPTMVSETMGCRVDPHGSSMSPSRRQQVLEPLQFTLVGTGKSVGMAGFKLSNPQPDLCGQPRAKYYARLDMQADFVMTLTRHFLFLSGLGDDRDVGAEHAGVSLVIAPDCGQSRR